MNPNPEFAAPTAPASKPAIVLHDYLPAHQYRTIKHGARGEEGPFFRALMDELQQRIEAMPIPYGAQGKGDDAICSLRYFGSTCDFYIIERDCVVGEPQHQCYGVANVVGEPELGYIDLTELFDNGVEMDLHFKPCTVAEAKARIEKAA